MELVDKVKNSGVKYIRYQFTDIFASLRGLEFPASHFEKYLQNGIGLDGSSVNFLDPENSDLKLQPDLSTFQVLPWNKNIAKITCNVVQSDSKPFLADPRTILQNVLTKIKQHGWLSQVRPELEYYVINQDATPITTSSITTNYMDLEPFDPFSDLRRNIIDYCLDLDMNVKYGHAEVGPGQQEIEMDFVDPLRAADELQMMKQIVRITADRKGYQATFLPKPFAGEAGSGLHIHQRLVDSNNESIFGNKEKISEYCYEYVGGLLKHAPAMTTFFNPITNSYKRMTPGHEAPVYLTWGIGNRTALVRVPGYEDSVRVEFRSADGASNIYLILALQLSAGLDGIENKITAPEPMSIDVTKLSQEFRKEKKIGQLPTNLYYALETMTTDPLVEKVLSKPLIDIFLKNKLHEWDEYNSGKQAVTPWEFRQFINYA